jgi:hypothetical protein
VNGKANDVERPKEIFLTNPFIFFKYFSYISRICRISVCPLVMRPELYQQVSWGDAQKVESPKGTPGLMVQVPVVEKVLCCSEGSVTSFNRMFLSPKY